MGSFVHEGPIRKIRRPAAKKIALQLHRVFEHRGIQIAAVDRERVGVQVSPHGGLRVQRAFYVVGLVGDHLADSYDQVVEAFAGDPVVAYADGGGVDVGMEDGG